MFSCWAKDPAERPTFSDVVKSLSRLLTVMSDYVDLNYGGATEGKDGQPFMEEAEPRECAEDSRESGEALPTDDRGDGGGETEEHAGIPPSHGELV